MADFDSILSKNPGIDGRIDSYLRNKDGVDRLYFNSDHVDGAKEGRYHEIDADDSISVQAEDGSLETVDAFDFASNDRFKSFGTPQQRLALLQKASKYEVSSGGRTNAAQLPVAEDLQGMVDRLDPNESAVPMEQSFLENSLAQYLGYRAQDAAGEIGEKLQNLFTGH